jgi:hypothetical protein
MSHRKIPAVRGLYWCLEAWRNLKKSPQPIFTMSMWLSLGTFLPVLNFFVLMTLTVFYGGMISSLHKKAHGETASLGDFFNGFKSPRSFLGLFMVGLPTILFTIFSSSVLVNTLGADTIKSLSQPGQPPEALQAILPVLVDIIIKLLPIAIVTGWIVFLAVPRVILDKRLGLAALWDSLRAVFSNLATFILFSLGMFTMAFLASFVLVLIMSLASATGALAGVLQTMVLVFMTTVAWALYLNAMYVAWRDIFMLEENTPAADTGNTGNELPSTQIEV